MMKFSTTCLLVAASIIIAFSLGCIPQTPKTNTPVFCSQNIDPLAGIVSSGFGMGINNRRNPSNALINSTNVGSLSFEHSVVDTKNDTRRGAVSATESTYYVTMQNYVYAADRDTGCAFWRFNYEHSDLRSASALLIDDIAVVGQRLLLVGTDTARVIALNANTGKVVWSVYAGTTRNGRPSGLSVITGGMQYYDGVVYTPIASAESGDIFISICCTDHGALTALRLVDGSRLWTYETTQVATMQDGLSYRYGPSGASIWSAPLIDPARNQVLVGTGQNFSTPSTETANAVVALDMTSGTEKWVYKGSTPMDFYNASCSSAPSPDLRSKHCRDDSYDFDMITPLLANAPNVGDIIIAADKAGWVYAINPLDGSQLWKSKIGSGGLLGGIHWGMAADSEKVYVGVADYKVPPLWEIINLNPFDISPVLVANATPGLYALDLETGILQWQVQDTHLYQGLSYPSVFSAGVSLSNDLLFTGSLDGMLKAWSTVNGQQLWSFDTDIPLIDVHGNIGNGGTIDSVGPIIVGDQIYLNSGYNITPIGEESEYQAGPGNALMVFGLNN